MVFLISVMSSEISFWFGHRNRCIATAVSRPSAERRYRRCRCRDQICRVGSARAGHQVVVLELPADGALAARRRGLEHVVCGSFDEVGFLPSSLAAIRLFDVLEHIQDEVAALARFSQVLKPGGRLYGASENHVVYHFRRYTVGSSARMLARGDSETEYHRYLLTLLLRPIFVLHALPYHLGRRQTEAIESFAAARSVTGITGCAIDIVLDWEARWIARDGRLAFGRQLPACRAKERDSSRLTVISTLILNA